MQELFTNTHSKVTFWSNISDMRKSVSSGYPNPEKWVEKTRRSRVFLSDFEVFGYLMKHSFELLIWLLKPFIILGGPLGCIITDLCFSPDNVFSIGCI